MEWVNSEHDKPIKSWCKDLEEQALAQAIDLANHPAVFRHVALMPDAHLGYGMPIGGVIACDKAVIPFAVGSDIGCGMAAVRTSYKAEGITTEQLKQIMGGIREVVPMGLGKEHEVDQAWEGFNARIVKYLPKPIAPWLAGARKQLGTLGSGNHFQELQAGDDGYLWLMLHSGSRRLGYNIADYYHKQAVKLCERWFSRIPCKELAFFPIEDPLGKEYMEVLTAYENPTKSKEIG